MKVGFSSQYSRAEHSAAQLLGKPRVFPAAGVGLAGVVNSRNFLGAFSEPSRRALTGGRGPR